MKKIYFHVDVNSAFLSWEAAYRTGIKGETIDLRSIPSVIGGSEEFRHGIVLAKSIPAKTYSIKTGEPLVSARKKCPVLVIVPPNYSLFVEASKALIKLLQEFSPDVTQYSIDEAFCDMTGTSSLFGSPVIAANMIKDKIFSDLGFTVNIGISSNKLLAKMASDFQKPNMVHTLFPEEIETKMWPLPVSDLFYVGRQTEKRLLQLGITTIGELANTDKKFLHSIFKSHGDLIWEFANGFSDQMEKLTLHPTNKGYGNSITLPLNVTDSNTAKLVLLSLTETISTRIRADKSYISVVSVSIVDWNFNFYTKQKTLLSSTNVCRQIYNVACNIFDQLWNHLPIRQLGIHTGRVTQESSYQYSLFDTQDLDKEKKLDKAIDSIRERYGEDSIMRASFLTPNLQGKISHMSGGLDKAKRSGVTKAIK